MTIIGSARIDEQGKASTKTKKKLFIKRRKNNGNIQTDRHGFK